jgi:hypothetical protein
MIKKFQSLAMVAVMAVGLAFSVPTATAGLNDWEPLSQAEQVTYEYNYRMFLDATNCTSLSSNTAGALFPKFGAPTVTFPAGTMVRRAAVKIITQFQADAGAATACVFKLGDAGVDPLRFLNVAIGTNATTGTWYFSTNAVPFTHTSPTNLSIALAPVGTTPANLTTGRVLILIQAVPLNNLTNF